MTSSERYDQIVQELLERVTPGLGGSPRPGFVADIRRLAQEAAHLAGHRYTREIADRVAW